jgi:hypothetical protein
MTHTPRVRSSFNTAVVLPSIFGPISKVTAPPGLTLP